MPSPGFPLHYIAEQDIHIRTGEKDKDGLVQSYFPSSRGIKTARYTLALYIDRKTKQLKKSLLFDLASRLVLWLLELFCEK